MAARKYKTHRTKSEPLDISFVVMGAPTKGGSYNGFTISGNLGRLPKGKKAIIETLGLLQVALESGSDFPGYGFDLHHTETPKKKASRK